MVDHRKLLEFPFTIHTVVNDNGGFLVKKIKKNTTVAFSVAVHNKKYKVGPKKESRQVHVLVDSSTQADMSSSD